MRFTVVQGGHQHDLPPLWDGQPIKWRGWNPGFRLTHFAQVCDRCGNTEPPDSNYGLVNNRIRMLAYRCTKCRLDLVVDILGDRTWVLDDDDYGPGGSVERDHRQ